MPASPPHPLARVLPRVLEPGPPVAELGGGEGGRLLEPTAFDLGANGTFAVADAPRGQERLQVFDASGKWLAGFFLPGRAQTRVSISGLAFGGVSAIARSSPTWL